MHVCVCVCMYVCVCVCVYIYICVCVLNIGTAQRDVQFKRILNSISLQNCVSVVLWLFSFSVIKLAAGIINDDLKWPCLHTSLCLKIRILFRLRFLLDVICFEY